LTVDARFAYLKDWPVWRNQGAEWCGEEHMSNVACFWGQFQKFAAREIFRACALSGPEAALAKYDAFAGDDAGEFIVDERTFDSLAESLFHEGYIDAAAAVAVRNARRFPDSWSVHLRVGETLRARGDDAGALAAFRKVLALAPENGKAKQRIAELEGR